MSILVSLCLVRQQDGRSSETELCHTLSMVTAVYSPSVRLLPYTFVNPEEYNINNATILQT